MRSFARFRVAALLILTAAFSACGDNDKLAVITDGSADSAEAGGEDAGVACPSISFVRPGEGDELDEGDDLDGDSCENGFQYRVEVATAAPDGTRATLFADNSAVGSARVSGATLVFEEVQLASRAETTLVVQIGPDCVATRNITIACDVPTCDITKPVVSPTHPELNGVPSANGGDRASAEGSPYQVAVEVVTSIENGQAVELTVDDEPVKLSTVSANGRAIFAGVTLSPDGAHTLEASCRAASGVAGRSALSMYTVDTAAPELSVTEPLDNAHFEDVETFRVCGRSPSEDARDLGEENFCAAIGSSNAVCAELEQDGTGGAACIDVPCPGGPPFELTVSLHDRAGNSVSKSVTGVTCRSDRPGVEIVSPTASSATDPSTRILAASSSQSRKDSDANMAGAQFTVVACTDASLAEIELLAGPAGEELTRVGAAVAVAAATPQDACPAGKPYAARFAAVTLPESREDSAGALQSATRLQARLTDESETTVTSPSVDVWVDSVIPTLAGSLPSPLCGYFRQDAGDWATELRIATSVLPLDVTITSADGAVQMQRATTHLAGLVASLGTVTFEQGVNQVAATVTEPSGNAAALPSPCAVTVGNPPIVTWVSPPAATTGLGRGDDGDPATAGWQGDLSVHTDLAGVAGATVQFSTNPGGNLGAPVAVNASGDATLTGVTIPEGASVQLTARTSDVPERGVGVATLTLVVDTAAPAAIASITATVPPDKRRQTTFRLAWTAPADGGGGPVQRYLVRVSKSAITAANFDAAEAVSYMGSPAQPGQPDGVDVPDQLIENDYYFAVAPVDGAGNRGEIATAGPARASFNQTRLNGTGGTGESYGRSVDGPESLNGDAYADLIVGSSGGSNVYIYFGAATGFAQTASVTITGVAGTQFGYAAEIIGDIDADGLPDLAIGAPSDDGTVGKVYIYKGRTTWSPPFNADYEISADDGADPNFAGAGLGYSFARLNDFDGDGADDFAIGAYKYGALRGYLAVIRGVRAQDGAFPASITLGTGSPRALELPGPDGFTGRFGLSLTSLGRFYGGSTSTLLASAPYYADTPGTAGSSRIGRVYALSAGSFSVSAPLDTFDGTLASGYGGWSMAPLGFLGGSPNAVIVGAPALTGPGGRAFVHLGNTTSGPFVASPVEITHTQTSEDGFGACTFGSVISGVAQSTADNRSSFIGSTLPDLAISSMADAGQQPKLYLIDGEKAPTLSSGVITDLADVTVTLPASWIGGLGCTRGSRAIRDLNGDGYADIALGQYELTGNLDGEVLVLW